MVSTITVTHLWLASDNAVHITLALLIYFIYYENRTHEVSWICSDRQRLQRVQTTTMIKTYVVEMTMNRCYCHDLTSRLLLLLHSADWQSNYHCCLYTTRQTDSTANNPKFCEKKPILIPAKAREYVFTGVGLCVCVCVSVCDHNN